MSTTQAATPMVQALLRGCVASPHQVRVEPADLQATSHDASHFLLRPEAVVAPRSADEVSRLLRGASQAGVGLTFRSGGTSLSGQAGTDKVLVDVRRHFTNIEVLDDGAKVKVQPGVTVNQVNARLAPYGRQLGPDPASSRACTIGGVVANNSSGMACGTVANTYKTLDSLVAVLPSGTVIDTGKPDADERLRLLEPQLYDGLIRLRDRVRANSESVAKITQQFSMKNTMGYGVNSFTDFTAPIDIFTHLLIGSEGTLAFVAEATFSTIPVNTFTGTALVVFDDLFQANSALPALVGSGAATLELMDATSLRVGQSFDDTPAMVKALQVDRQAALLIEYQATASDAFDDLVARARPVLADLPVDQPVTLTADHRLRDGLWALRNGLYTSVAGARKPGTTALLEDVVVPVGSLAQACVDLAELFDQYQYADSVIFGHAKDGNIHFMITDRFEGQALDRYRDFTEAMVDVVLGHEGSLKAEHGTGRVMAPFVERQYGHELYEVMVEVKRLFDPKTMLNDSVVISDDPQLHLKNIKLPVLFDSDFDRCSECGYCEPVCPSRGLSLTPRMRIALRRDVALAQLNGDAGLVEDIERRYVYDGVQTCAVCGMCSTACPMKINTANLIKKFRSTMVAAPVASVWTTAAKHWQATTTAAATAMDVTHALRVAAPVITAVNEAARSALGTDTIPLWSKELPGGGKRRHREPVADPEAIYLPACVNRMFGPARGVGVQSSFERLCAKVGIRLLVPDDIDSLCCGTPWSSKGLTKGHEVMGDKVLKTLHRISDGGRLPVVCDASSCTEGFAKIIASDPTCSVTMIDAVQFVVDQVLPKLDGVRKLASVTLHPTCSSTQIGLNPALRAVAEACADRVEVPVMTGCCAFAGDRGMLHPELTRSATRPEAKDVAATPTVAYASCNRTCELGMTRATGQTYRHIVEILAEQAGV
ncbi:MAG: FAD-binding oxidoreductase [Propionibacteriaceae bacterium]|jgi:D-lactate dehydrogenase|nr:FAD-binding oxidoreductase [Propionibacteriaceae bacterium]